MSKHAYERRIKRKREEERRKRRRVRRTRLLKVWGSVGGVLVAGLLMFLFWPSGGGMPAASKTPTPSPSASSSPAACTKLTPAVRGKKAFPSAPCDVIDHAKLYDATLETSMGTVKLEMDPRVAPKSVNNFVFLARAGYYDGSIFHRVQNEKDFAIVQGGDGSNGDGTGSPGYSYAGETPAPGTKYLRGTFAMANSGDPSSNGSQFFIVVHDWPTLPPNYTVFGKVIDEGPSFKTLESMITAKGTPIQGGLGTRPEPPIKLMKVTITERAR